ncbi:GNAT family N-acetyltransferase [Brevibacterium daeguense]|uniref:GNAT family N-acetyltransferase n=1 Tax=Brevibacterium daeguense TaxID=909936 RepID=A0ABP8EJF3_9MICO|nr:GNAT family N-acetyltransferase [Brevibacterium daeguense]
MSDEITVSDNPDESRYDIFVDGTHAGFSAYRDTDVADAPQRILHHTEIDDEFGGRGLASTLTRKAISSAVADGRRVVPVCPYVKSWVEKHDDFADDIDPVTSGHLALFS